MHDIKIGKLQRQLPGKWNELTGKQLLGIIAVSTRIPSIPGLKPHQIQELLRLETLFILLNVPRALLMLFTPLQLLQFYWLMPFLEKGGFSGLTAQLFPKLRVPGFLGWFRPRLFGPRERIRNMSFLEFIYADTFFTAYTQKQNPAMLDKLVSCLYRKKRWFHFLLKRLASYGGDCRQEFNPYFVDGRARLVARFSLEQKLAILCWYRDCREELEREFPLVFSGSNQKTAGRKGWDGVLLGMSGHVMNIESTGKANIRSILGMMQQRFEEVEEAKKQRDEN
ncbi:hypothetical protein [Rufibacter hautae]|uniref:Uncharacterized protein n=1 Tax=Rufibacter hautae TaxID=2595005 RepID=A0A5B6TJG1_9BACT|nr:hypothetical protein [Rufibacter hautae]KAA3439570.1 hypothetical protein FOA19_02475 [Rufibacter hautae]